MKLYELNPFLRYASFHRCYEPPRSNSVCYDCRLFYLPEGDGVLSANGEDYHIEGDTAIYLPPETHYRFIFGEAKPVKIYAIDFDLTDEHSEIESSLNTATEESFCKQRVPKYDIPEPFRRVIIKASASPILGYIAAAAELFLHRELYYRESASANVKLALLSMLRVPGGDAGDYVLAERIIAYVRESYQLSALTNKTIAEEMHYHPYHLSRVMKAYTGMTLRDYVTDYRIRMAKNLLITTSAPVTEIAESCGFASYTHFIKTFRVRVGESPLKYRQSHRIVGL